MLSWRRPGLCHFENEISKKFLKFGRIADPRLGCFFEDTQCLKFNYKHPKKINIKEVASVKLLTRTQQATSRTCAAIFKLTEPSFRLDFGPGRDDKYWERRRKNNVAAKKSRDARRVRENQLRVKVLCLENANQVTGTRYLAAGTRHPVP